MTASNAFGRQVVVPLANKSGGGVVLGDVVVIDSANNDAFTTTTSANSTATIGVAQETIANNATGRVLITGYASLVNVNASVTRGHYGATHTVAKQAADAGTTRTAGTFCIFLTGGTTPDAIVYPSDLSGAALTNPMTTAGDIIVADTGGTPLRLAKGADSTLLTISASTHLPVWQAAATPSLTHSTNQLSGDVTMTSANTWYDGPSLSLAAGTWLLVASILLQNVSVGCNFTTQLWDGSTVAASGMSFGGVAFARLQNTLVGIVSPGSTTTYKISAACDATGGKIKAAGDVNGVGNNASTLVAVRIG